MNKRYYNSGSHGDTKCLTEAPQNRQLDNPDPIRYSALSPRGEDEELTEDKAFLSVGWEGLAISGMAGTSLGVRARKSLVYASTKLKSESNGLVPILQIQLLHKTK